MGTSNPMLILSLAQDLKIIQEVSDEMGGNLTSFELNSWLYPWKSYTEVKWTNDEKDDYLNYLERIVDKLHLYLNLARTHIENMLGVQKQRNVYQSRTLTLAVCTKNLWFTIVQLRDLFHKSKTPAIKKSDDERAIQMTNETQTEVNSTLFQTCDSCNLVIEALKQLIKGIENVSDTSKIKTARRDLQNNLFDLTQFGSVNRLVNAILQDVTDSVQQLKQLREEKITLFQKNRDLESKNGQANKQIEKLQETIKEHDNLIEHLQNDIKTEKEIALENQKIIAKLQNEIIEKENLLSSLMHKNNSLQVLVENKNMIETQLKLFTDEKSLLDEKFRQSELENREIKSDLMRLLDEDKRLRTQLDEINIKISSIDKNNQDLEEFLLENKEKLRNGIRHIQEILELKINEHTQEKNRAKTVNVKGNPLIDMRNQIQLNQIQINSLTIENSALQNTIDRLEKSYSC